MSELERRILDLFDALITLSEVHGLGNHPYHESLVKLRCELEDRCK